MNDFRLFEQLCVAENIANQYKYGASISERIRELEEVVKSRKYRVAVIGEFKRGKSSLINALIGAQVLPTDILPMTASITHIHYGEEKRITIEYKDGSTEKKSIEELIDYATKFDEEKEKTSESIKEVLVSYPSVLCKNNIDIFDTPGMNDDEKMSKITLSILGDIDAAIMVISACSPLSMTEQELIIRLIEEQGIRHIIFAVTYIDAVSVEINEQDRIIEHIKKRIASDILSRSTRRFDSDEMLKKKAEQILSNPHIYGVSSTLAMEGFITDSRRKQDLSRLPVFKQELLAYLVSAQSIDTREKVAETLNEVESNIFFWYETEHKELNSEKQALQKTRADYESYFSNSTRIVTGLLSEIDAKLANIGLLAPNDYYYRNLFKAIRSFFIDNLFLIRENTNTEESILRAIRLSFDKADELIQDFNSLVSESVDEALLTFYSEYLKIRPCYSGDLSEEHALQSFKEAFQLKKLQEKCPILQSEKAVMALEQIKGINVIEMIEVSLNDSIRRFTNGFDTFFKTWRTFFLQHHEAMLQKKDVVQLIDKKVSDIDLRLSVLEYNISHDRDRLKAAISILEERD